MSDPTLTIDDLTALPEKMRAHAAAKAVGMTSKEFLAAMSGIGVEIKSAQSAVTRETLLTWFEGRGAAEGATAAPVAAEQDAAEPDAAALEAAPAKKAPAKKAPAKKAAAKKAPAKKAAAKKAPAKKSTAADESEPESEAVAVQADESAPGSGDTAPATKAPRKRAPRKTAAQKAAEAEAAGAGESSTRASSQDRPVLPSIAIVTGEVGTADTGNRRRRSTATPSFSSLFLSADDSAQTGSAGSDSATTGSSATGTSATAASSDESGQDAGEGHDQSGQGEGRRRRRGRRGRGRGRGEGADDQNTENNDDDENSSNESRNADSANDSGSETGPGAADSADGGDDADGTEKGENSSVDDSDASESTPSGSRRRRRRRRRGGGSGTDDSQGSSDDPPNTEIHERDGRRRSGRSGSTSGTSEDEVQGITGSTRLEAKRQRRRDGREAGRRRQPILSESEFLARRESVDRVMVVREKPRDDGKGIMTQVGVLEDKVLVEHFVTTESARSMVGNVYLGRVQNVLPSMEAAFVDIGRGRNGVLYAGEVNWEAAGLGGKARRIEQALKPGDMVLVQVTKDPVGQKGARLSTQISLAGRFLVYVPDGNSAGISRKLPDTERRRLKAILKDVVPEGSGVIIRTAAEGVSEEEIKRDVDRLAGQWTEISEAADKRKGSGSGNPVALYEEPDLLVKVVRDLFNEDFTKLVIQGETSWKTVHDYVMRVAPEMVERLE
ncbi:MAG: S1 RNA-binding domain-containing protein, partial [Actinomycetales bacterium]|nr:S1 RNA-binding domain-containing protein [Actinomycetales bacterium]